MKKILVTFVMLGAIFLLTLSSAQANSFSFGDTQKFWPGFSNGVLTPNIDGTIDDLTDAIGTPNVSGGTGIIDNGYLTSVTINSNSTNELATSSLFIDADSNGYWDYVIQGAAHTVYGLTGFDSSILSNYILSSYNGSTGTHFRENHPYQAVISTNNIGLGYAEYSVDTTTRDLTISLNADLIFLGDAQNFIIAWTPECANDVIYEHASVPEPTQMLLLGTALIGLAGIGRKKFFKK